MQDLSGAQAELLNDPPQRSSNHERKFVMTILWTLLIGLLVGIVAKAVMPGRDPGGIIITALIGIAGAFIASAIGRGMGWYTEGEPAGFLAAVGGSIILLALYRVIVGRRRVTA